MSSQVIRGCSLFLLLALLSACGMLKPDLKALYRLDERQQNFQPPVIIVPGIVSSKLEDANGNEVWFGGLRKILFSSYPELELEIDPETLEPLPSKLRASTLPNTVLGSDFFGPIFETLETVGYRYTEPGTPYTTQERRYYKFAYDWRYGNVTTARKLDALIEQIREDYNRPDLQVDLIGHSMGGLVIRYYLRYGTVDVLDDNDFPVTQAGAKKARRVILLGSPNLGSVGSLRELLEGYKVVFGRIPTESMITMPSIYQLLPHPIVDWIITANGESLNRDIFDSENLWRRFQWSIFDPEVMDRVKANHDNPAEGQARVELLQAYFHKHIERARRFVWSLSVKFEDPIYELINFGGDCTPTPARILVEEIDGESVVRLDPKKIKNKVPGVDYEALMLEPGDGRVTKPSMLAREFLDPNIERHQYSFFPVDYSFFLCENHVKLTGNINFQDNLLNVLLERVAEEPDFMN